jgi:hypothetical protein
MMKVKIKTKGLTIFTEGLSNLNNSDIRVIVNDSSLLPDAQFLVKYVVDYLINQHANIKSGETIIYGYWHVKFLEHESGYLDAWEFNQECSEYILGVTLSVSYMKAQGDLCHKHDAEFLVPFSHDYAIVSDGVLEGAPVEGARHPSLEGLSGWWFTTELFNGDIHTLRREHLYHITAKRPELAGYLALPPGYWFLSGQDGDNVSFDPSIAAQEPV